jgi:LL-diaminopimelate aminotransferase
MATRFNGVPYPVQRAAAAVYTPEGQREARGLSDYYLGNAKVIRGRLVSLGWTVTGGENSPYLWMRTCTDSWKFFDALLDRAGVVCTPGSGFGRCGEGYVRISAFNDRVRVEEAMERFAAADGELKSLADG